VLLMTYRMVNLPRFATFICQDLPKESLSMAMTVL
jgi:hypothetical protein